MYCERFLIVGCVLLFVQSLKGQTTDSTNVTTTLAVTVPAECANVRASVSENEGWMIGLTSVNISVSGNFNVTAAYICSLNKINCTLASQSASINIPVWSKDLGDVVTIIASVGQCGNVSAGNFTYKNVSVTVFSVNSLQTIVQGGIKLLFSYSVGQPDAFATSTQIVIKVSSGGTEDQTFTESCTANGTFVICITPDLSSASAISSQNFSYGQQLSSSSLNFETSIFFDNVTVFSTSSLLVFQVPNLIPLAPLQSFVANQNNMLTIQGTNLVGHGFTVDDISVTVGESQWMSTGSNLCTDVQLTNTSITCFPPPMDENIIKFPPSNSKVDPTQPNVTVMIGSKFSFPANQLQYILDEPFSLIMCVMITILGSVIVISVICVIMTLCGCGRRPKSTLSATEAVPYAQLSNDTKSASFDAESMDTTQHSKQKSKRSSTKTRASDAGFDVPADSSNSAGIQVKAVRKISEFDPEGVYENVSAVI